MPAQRANGAKRRDHQMPMGRPAMLAFRRGTWPSRRRSSCRAKLQTITGAVAAHAVNASRSNTTGRRVGSAVRVAVLAPLWQVAPKGWAGATWRVVSKEAWRATIKRRRLDVRAATVGRVRSIPPKAVPLPASRGRVSDSVSQQRRRIACRPGQRALVPSVRGEIAASRRLTGLPLAGLVEGHIAPSYATDRVR